MRPRRPPRDNDQEEAEKAFNILRSCILKHPHIESTLWASACVSLMVNAWRDNGFTFEEFASEMFDILEFFKDKWERVE
jgi:hypothetical protein